MLTKSEQNVVDCVSAERVTALCRKLVSIPTVNPYSGDQAPSGEKAGLDFIEGVFKTMGAETSHIPCDDTAFDKYKILATKGRLTEGRHNVVAVFTFGTGKGPSILLDAHMDTVAVDSYDGNPFAAEVKDGKIYGRGSSDDKGGIAAITEAIRALLDSTEPLDGKVFCCTVTDEECDGAGRGSLSCLAHLPRPDMAVLIDGDHKHIQDGCNGVITANITVHGRAGHAAYGALNAIEQAFKLLPAFEAYRKQRGDFPGVMNIGVFQAGNHPANVPAVAHIGINMRTTLEDMEAARKVDGVDSGRLARKLFEKCINDVVSRDKTLSELPPVIHWTKDMPATSSSKVDPDFLEFCRQAYVDACGVTPHVGPLGGWGDLAHFLRDGVPTVGLGTGILGISHSANEAVTIQGLVDTSKAIALILKRKLGC